MSSPWSGKISERQTTIALADRGAVLHLERVDRGDERGAVERRRLDDLVPAGEGDEADLDVLRQLREERSSPLPARDERLGLTSVTRAC
jgi:hypothetical protein